MIWPEERYYLHRAPQGERCGFPVFRFGRRGGTGVPRERMDLPQALHHLRKTLSFHDAV
jgi:hypothetical protein